MGLLSNAVKLPKIAYAIPIPILIAITIKTISE
jgi:hypothetical protein